MQGVPGQLERKDGHLLSWCRCVQGGPSALHLTPSRYTSDVLPPLVPRQLQLLSGRGVSPPHPTNAAASDREHEPVHQQERLASHLAGSDSPGLLLLECLLGGSLRLTGKVRLNRGAARSHQGEGRKCHWSSSAPVLDRGSRVRWRCFGLKVV